MMKLPVAFGVALMVLGSALFAKEGWTEDFEAGLAKAKAEKKTLLVDFTGSDWCAWCVKLDREVFSQSQFKEYASKNLVLVEVDFPQTKAQAPEQKAKNEALAAKYNVMGYPTVLLFNGAGEQIGQMGYMKGGPKAFIAALKKLTKP
jgi:protein disulfide-isomerase